MKDNMADQNTLRDMLETNLDASEAGTLGNAPEPIAVTSAPADAISESAAQRTRDEQGRFANGEKSSPRDAAQAPAAAQVADPLSGAQVDASAALQRPTTWKKEYLPIWDKLSAGGQLTPEESRKLADYSQQREREFATGVSTYRAEAQQANEIRAAVEPFMPVLQQHGMKVSDWISNLGNAHRTLSLGTPQQKLQMFANMAQQYGVPIQAIMQTGQGQQVDPMVHQMMQQMQDMNNKVASVSSWREQQENQALQQQIAEFTDTSKYPHFEQVRPIMAQLLEKGMAPDLKTAYTKAVRMDDEAWSAEQERQASAAQTTTPAAQIAAATKAKANAVSPRSTTPSGSTVTSAVKDRRALLSEGLSAASSRV